VSFSTQQRIGGFLLGSVFLIFIPAVLLGPAIGDDVSFAALPSWAAPASIGSAVLGAWHIASSILALEEDLELITGYFQAQDAAPLVLPFALFVGTRSVYRRFCMPAFVARERWLARRNARLHQVDVPLEEAHERFVETIPREP
jgi:hypothetical protein